VEEKILANGSLSFYAKQNSHLDKYKINDVDNKLSFPSLSFLFKKKNISFIYSGDIGISKDLYLFNEKTDWFIAEISHINLDELLPLLRQHLTGQIVLTHIDDESNIKIEKFLNSLENDEKNRFLIVQDGHILQHNS
jgi:ribonuclease BN (tRNA processing enzyme)